MDGSNGPSEIYINDKKIDVDSYENFKFDKDGEFDIEAVYHEALDIKFSFETPNSYLVSIDFSNLDTSSFNSIRMGFINCEKLVSLDFSNFNTSKFIFGDDRTIFLGVIECPIEYINIYNYTGINIFYHFAEKNLTICNNSDISKFESFNVNHTKFKCFKKRFVLTLRDCLFSNINFGIELEDGIKELNAENKCLWKYEDKIKQDIFIFKYILFRENTIFRSDYVFRKINITEIKEIGNENENGIYQDCTYKKYSKYIYLECGWKINNMLTSNTNAD